MQKSDHPGGPPTLARVSSLAHWATFFHPSTGVFRLPRTDGATIKHLDIDLRFIDHELRPESGKVKGDVYLPHVCIITLRGAEHVCDSDDHMEALAEVLLAIKPMEVRW